MSKPASDKQVAFATRLLSERYITLGCASLDEALVATDLANQTMGNMKQLIDRLLNDVPKNPDDTMPEVVRLSARHGKGVNRPGKCWSCPGLVTEGTGYYFLAGDGKWAVHHAVGACVEATDEPVVHGIDISHVPDGKYADPSGDTRLKVKIEHTNENSKWRGTIFVNDAATYGWEGRMGRQEPGGLYIGKSMDVLARIAADPQAAMAQYGHITNKCGKCGRPLEDEVSVARGIGPVCIQKLGW